MRKIILAYHRVLPETSGVTLAVSCADFERQLQYLLKKKYTFVRLKEYLSAKGNVCAVTFDDGYADNYYYAWPILKKYDIPATIFLTTDYIGRHKPFYWDLKNTTHFTKDDYALTWDQVREMAAAGIEFGSHTVHHYELNQLSEQEIHTELTVSKALIEQQLQLPVVSLCYPRGAYKPLLRDLAKAAGYTSAVMTQSKQETPYTLRRIGLYSHDDFGRFVLKVSPLFNILRRFK